MRTRELLHKQSALILCECGCGELIHSLGVHGEPVKYKKKHYAKILGEQDGVTNRFKKGEITDWTFIKGERKAHQSKAGKGNKHWNWKGGKIEDSKGYWYIYKPDHPFADPKGYIKEHRLVMEKYLDRYLTDQEVVHHINGDKKDNIIENLELMTWAEHCIHHKPRLGNRKHSKA